MSKKLIQAAAGAGGESVYVEDVFSTYLYEGTNTTHSINNGIDLSGEGGLVWIKNRTTTTNHVLTDTERGAQKILYSNATSAEATGNWGVNAFESTGFEITGSDTYNNALNNDYVSWSFRKQAGFFDVVTYTGDGTSSRQIPHNLGSTPGVIIVKSTSLTENWGVYHKDLTAGNVLLLSSTNAAGSAPNWFTTNSPTNSTFYVGSDAGTNWNGATYVAYLFAHDDQSFGDNSDESIIKCGSYTGTGLAGLEVDLGFEPQWLMFKRTDSTSDWSMFDVMRGIVTGGDDARLRAQGSDAENTFNYVDVTATGFSLSYGGTDMNASGGTYIYIAIRRPMKTPEAGTEVFAGSAVTTTGSSLDVTNNINMASGSLVVSHRRDSTSNTQWFDNLRGPNKRLKSNSTDAEDTLTTSLVSWNMDGFTAGTQYGSGESQIFWSFKRATGFFDVVAYTGDGNTSRSVSHNLGVTPELVIFKSRSFSSNWWTCFDFDGSGYDRLVLDLNNAAAALSYAPANELSAAPSSTSLTLGSTARVNGSGYTYIAYLFATLAGVSKVGSYTGNGSSQDIDCGFSSSARFVLIKRTDAIGDWLVYDSARGIVSSGNDKLLRLNLTSTELTYDDIDPYSSGFTIKNGSTVSNISGASYIFLAIA